MRDRELGSRTVGRGRIGRRMGNQARENGCDELVGRSELRVVFVQVDEWFF